LKVAGLLALVADTLLGGLLRTVAGEMANFTAVVALLALGAVARHMAETAARVASLAAATTTIAVTACVATAVTACVTTALGAVAGNVAILATLVAFLV